MKTMMLYYLEFNFKSIPRISNITVILIPKFMQFVKSIMIL